MDPFGLSGARRASGAIWGHGRHRFSAKQPIFFRLFLVLIRVYSWFFLDDSFVNSVRDRFSFGGWEKLHFALGFCC